MLENPLYWSEYDLHKLFEPPAKVLAVLVVFGMAWHIGTAWHGISWHGMAWHGMAWHGMASWHGMARHRIVARSSLWHANTPIP